MDLLTATLPLYEAKRWIKFLGGTFVGFSIFYALTIVGLLIAWLFLWLGVLLWQAGSQIDTAFAKAEEFPIPIAFQKLRRFFVIAGVTTLIYLTAIAAALVLWGATVFGFVFESM